MTSGKVTYNAQNAGEERVYVIVKAGTEGSSGFSAQNTAVFSVETWFKCDTFVTRNDPQGNFSLSITASDSNKYVSMIPPIASTSKPNVCPIEYELTNECTPSFTTLRADLCTLT